MLDYYFLLFGLLCSPGFGTFFRILDPSRLAGAFPYLLVFVITDNLSASTRKNLNGSIPETSEEYSPLIFCNSLFGPLLETSKSDADIAFGTSFALYWGNDTLSGRA